MSERLAAIVEKYGNGNFTTRGRGMFQGINCVNGELAGKITKIAFQKGLIIETSGADDHVVKLLCPLIIDINNLSKGLDIIEEAVREVCAKEDSIPKQKKYFNPLALAS